MARSSTQLLAIGARRFYCPIIPRAPRRLSPSQSFPSYHTRADSSHLDPKDFKQIWDRVDKFPGSKPASKKKKQPDRPPPPPPRRPLAPPPPSEEKWAAFTESMGSFPAETPFSEWESGGQVVIHGFLGKLRNKGGKLSFINLERGLNSLQIISKVDSESEDVRQAQEAVHGQLKSISSHSPVCVTGTLHQTDLSPQRTWNDKSWELRPESIRPLNTFPKDIIISEDSVWRPRQRHLELRFDRALRSRLELRSDVASSLRKYLDDSDFKEVETPILFKSTPEGAREFLVPTRTQGVAYALPQSPQQYKQVLMATGWRNYYQFARCFRDEDHRSDRQPEFTQLDLEMSFATSETVMSRVEDMVKRQLGQFVKEYSPAVSSSEDRPRPESRYPARRFASADETATNESQISSQYSFDDKTPFPRITYHDAMRLYGTDKPDLRIKVENISNITRVEHLLDESFTGMITKLRNPIVEACKITLPEDSPEPPDQFIKRFMDGLRVKLTPGSTPAVLVYDEMKPLQGLSSMGHEAADAIASLETEGWTQCKQGDIIIIHARKDEPFEGGSTDLGRLRTELHDCILRKGLLPNPDEFKLCWVYDFPMFTANDEDPGQGGWAGFSSTHHPFTAPKDGASLELLKTDPLKAIADSYDLVLNGVEVGGGSRRIHVAELQEWIMESVLQMTPKGIERFSHLIEALRTGCPPHAGFALGFDRLIAVLCNASSVRSVIAFPKNNNGFDLFANSPTRTTADQKKTYHLRGLSNRPDAKA